MGKSGYSDRRPLEIVWTEAAVEHLEQATGFIEADSMWAAGTIRRRILHTVKNLGPHPYAGRVGRIEGTREAVVPRSPFIVVYQVSRTAVEILGIRHGAREWPDFLEDWNS